MSKSTRSFLTFLVLFGITIFTTTLAGSEWIYGKLFLVGSDGKTSYLAFGEWMTWEKFIKGFSFSIPFLAFLTFHEFGHYFTAKHYRVKTTLPFYIPLWLGITSTIGTMGAFIQLQNKPISRKQFFDIGIAGPLAGFAVALGVLYYGYIHLPPKSYVFEIHPEYKTLFPEEYKKYGIDYEKYAYKYPQTPENEKAGVVGKEIEGSFGIGKNLIMVLLEEYVVEDKSRIPHPNEMMHYPFLFAGFLGLLFTALNLIPIGQLDGGHILYGLVGFRNHAFISPILFSIFVFYAGLGMVTPYQSTENLMLAIPLYVWFLYLMFSYTLPRPQSILLLSLAVFTAQFALKFFFPTIEGYSGWLLFCFLLGRFLGIYHPPAERDEPLSVGRKILGWFALLIFLMCFSPQPFIISYE